jgi:ABC-type Fe3+-hydroxamate transport system substrate-binding protein
MAEFFDQLNRKVNLGDTTPRRLISLVPSITELLFDLGLENRMVGCTKFCIHPPQATQSLPSIGGTKKIDIDKIMDLRPDLIIGNKEENTKEDIEQLATLAPVWVSDVNTIDDALKMISCIGIMTDTMALSNKMVSDISESFDRIQPYSKNIRAAYLIWKKPWMVAASNTFIDDMMKWAGMENVFKQKNRYPEISLDELNAIHPEVVLLSSEPYPFSITHIDEISAFLPEAKIITVDGTFFSWYGSRLTHAANYFTELNGIISNPIKAA